MHSWKTTLISLILCYPGCTDTSKEAPILRHSIFDTKTRCYKSLIHCYEDAYWKGSWKRERKVGVRVAKTNKQAEWTPR